MLNISLSSFRLMSRFIFYWVPRRGAFSENETTDPSGSLAVCPVRGCYLIKVELTELFYRCLIGESTHTPKIRKKTRLFTGSYTREDGMTKLNPSSLISVASVVHCS